MPYSLWDNDVTSYPYQDHNFNIRFWDVSYFQNARLQFTEEEISSFKGQGLDLNGMVIFSYKYKVLD